MHLLKIYFSDLKRVTRSETLQTRGNQNKKTSTRASITSELNSTEPCLMYIKKVIMLEKIIDESILETLTLNAHCNQSKK